VAASRLTSLEIDQDLDSQRRSWRIQRLGWVLMAAFVLAATAGLLGSGPLSHRRVTVPGVMVVDYDRFARLQTDETLTVRLEPAATAAETVRLSLDRGFLDSARVQSVLPPPVRVEAAAGRLVYVFSIAEPGVPMIVTFAFEPREFGSYRGRVAVEFPTTMHRVEFRQLVYP
jgi:hypothetical protein